MIKPILTVSLLSLVIVGAGCQRSAMPSSTIAPYQSNADANGVANGSALNVGDDVAIPADFPQDMPRYPHAKTHAVIGDANQHTYSLTQNTNDSVDAVKTWLSPFMFGQGFSVSFEAGDSPDLKLINYVKGNIKINAQISHDASSNLTTLMTTRVEN